MRYFLIARYAKASLTILSQAKSPLELSRAIKEILRKAFHLLRYRWINRRSRRKSLNPVNHQITYKELDAFLPLVSVIVPNYNHGQYLHQRLQSIYAQTYENIEVILLDDNSTDDSIQILREFKNRYPLQTELILNDKNSGSGYHQWLKGINLAKGDLVWIAESDDISDLCFLETLVTKFANPGVSLAFCNTQFFTTHIGKPTWNLHSYWSDKTELPTHMNWIISDKQFIGHGMSRYNLIPNVSSCMFRANSLAKNKIEWTSYKYVGDWLFYHISMLGGLISYESKFLNYYRSHENGVITKNRNSQEFKCELVSVKRAIEVVCNQKRILMAIPGMALGGGEIFAYRLAACLVNHDFTVSILNTGIVPDVDTDLFQGPIYIPILIPQSQFEFAQVMFVEFDCLHTHHGSVDYMVSQNNSNDVPQIISLHGMYEEMHLRDVARSEVMFDSKNVTFTYLAEKNLSAFTPTFLSKKNFMKVKNFIPASLIPKFERVEKNQSINIAVISRAIEGKGWIDAISSVEIAIQNHELDLKLNLYGSGPLYQLSIEKYHYPWLSISQGTQAPLKTLADSDLYLFLSTYPGESMPLVILECLATGTPVVFSNIPILHELLFDEEGPIGFPIDLCEGDISTIQVSEKIKEFSELSIADLNRLRKRMEKKYSEYEEKNVIQSYIKLYDGVTQSSS
jgi:glycosyltransferase involved in cell wall biosynthesis